MTRPTIPHGTMTVAKARKKWAAVYRAAQSGDPAAMWRVKYHGKVVCKKIKGVHRATAWANDHNTRRVLNCLDGYDD